MNPPSTVRQVAAVASTMLCVLFLTNVSVDARGLSISSVHADVSSGHLLIAGAGFQREVRVVLGSTRLSVVSVSPHEIRAALPDLRPGSYQLVVRPRRGPGAGFIVTLGAGAPGPPGPAGPPGPQGEPGLSSGGSNPTVAAANGATVGTVVGITKFGGSDPTFVARQHDGVWLAIPVDSDGVVPMSFLALYSDESCTTEPYVPMDGEPAPLFRLLQSTDRSEDTAYYAGSPTAVMTFSAWSPLGRQEMCFPTAGTGWDAPLLAGPLGTFDLSGFPGPFEVR